MAPVYKIALIQMYPEPLRVESNYEKAANFIRSAAAWGAQLAVLPEYHLTSWVPDDPQFAQLCEQWEIYLNRYKALAKSLNICIVPGTIVEAHEDEETGEKKLWNVAYFIDNRGLVIGRYEKKNLWHPERPHLSASPHDSHPVFDTPLGPVGLLICWDLAFPEAFRELIAHGAKMVIIPTFWTLADCSQTGLQFNPLSEKLFLDSITNSRAFENTCAVVFVNAGGPRGVVKDGTYAGLSRVSLPFVGALGDETKDTNEEGMSIVDVDMGTVEEAERNYKVREDMASDDWHYLYRHDTLNEKS